MAEKNQFQIIFMPSGKRGHFDPGTTILQASRSLGVDLDSVCGGRAICGRCQIQPTEGEFAKHGITSSFSNLNRLTESEIKYSKRKGLEASRRLGCQTIISGDVVIDIPEESQLHQQVVRKEFEASSVTINPLSKLHLIDLSQSSFDSNDQLQQLINEKLRDDWGIEISQILPKYFDHKLFSEADNGTIAVREKNTVVDIWPGLVEKIYGVSIDIGSTTLAVNLSDLQTGEVMASEGSMNPQIRFGEDLMSRVSYCMLNPGSEEKLTKTVRESIKELITKACKKVQIDPNHILEATVVGNPVMHHLFLGFDPVPLGVAPFKLKTSDSVTESSKDLALGINDNASVYVLPCLAGHVGADAAAVILTEKPYQQDAYSLIVDVGTNAEIIVGNKDKVLAASSPTGPAFEGAQINSGQRAAPGAIERVRIDPETLVGKIKVIGSDLWSDDPDFDEDTKNIGVTGICGSGIIEAIAEMFLTGIISSEGLIQEQKERSTDVIFKDGRTFSYLLFDGKQKIIITQNDIRAIQLAKAALYAGAKLLMDKIGISAVDKIRFAGAFGSHIDVKYAMVLGLIPNCKISEVTSAGNAASTGARIALLDSESRQEIETAVKQIEKIETATEPLFQDYFVKAMSIPHESDDFSELKKIFKFPEKNNVEIRSKRKRRRT
ncbi:MAG: drug:proton antiporter [Gammaproteobacteria bacterium TMED36]|nr:MAG: drug:proton antiporter [Gammaproteobacteria bacterium TMED36]|tara:strand:- start:7011 stop:9002 length:1992 start_codon:yes stop_codon:yes gene_type:complete